MQKFLVLNDLHLGVIRTAGTTPASAIALRSWLHDLHNSLINDTKFDGHDLIYNGDIFDTFSVPLGDAMQLVNTWSVWLNTHAGNIHAGRGNHDISKDSSRCSMFDFVCGVMQVSFPGRFFTHTKFAAVSEKVFILPHCTNQEEFDAELIRAAGIPDGAILLLHANYDNPFSENSDHSLSVSVAQAETFRAKGCKLLFGHEHDHKLAAGGLVWITGNQFPTSIADLLGDPTKYYAEIIIDGCNVPKIVMTAMPEYGVSLFQQVDWQDVANLREFAHFIKVTGSVSAEDNVKVIEVVSSLRSLAAEAFVVSNGVRVHELDDVAQMQVTSEEIKAINVFEFLYAQLDAEQVIAVKKLMEAENVI